MTTGADYLTLQARALAEAVHAEAGGGVAKRSFQLAEHLAAEGGIHRGDVLTATATLLALKAWSDGEDRAARRFASLAGEHGPESRELVRNLLRLEAGADRGWLPETELREVIAYARRARRGDLERRARTLAGRPEGD